VGVFRRGGAVQGTSSETLGSKTRCELVSAALALDILTNISLQRSTCVNHDAVNKPDREARGLAASGVVTVDCARHNLKRPNGVGDVQLGER
jgi:hypothetical protein